MFNYAITCIVRAMEIRCYLNTFELFCVSNPVFTLGRIRSFTLTGAP